MARQGRRRRRTRRLSGTLGPFVFVGLVVVAAAGLTVALRMTLGPGGANSQAAPSQGGANSLWDVPNRYAADGSVIPTPGGSGRPSSIKNPEPWEYDPVSNQHWHEPHWHWHHGPPPPPQQRN